MQLKLMNAQQQTLLDRINERVGPNYSRMAGGSLALQLAPMAMSVLDNEETGLREAAAASLLSTGVDSWSTHRQAYGFIRKRRNQARVCAYSS